MSNVIVRNISIKKVLADTGDAIGIQEASKVWINHVDLSSDRDHDKDYVSYFDLSIFPLFDSEPILTINAQYDGLCDITHGS